MLGWIAVGGDSSVWVKPVDWEEVYVVQLNLQSMVFECWHKSVGGVSRLIGTGDTPRRAAELVPKQG